MPANDSFRWNQKSLHAVFAASSVLLLGSVILMMKKDHTDEWRDIQRTNFELEAAVRERELRAIQSPEYATQKKQLETRLAEARERLEAARTSQRELFSGQLAATREVERLETLLKFRNSDRDEARANYDLAVRDALAPEVTSERLSVFQMRQAECNAVQRELEAAQTVKADFDRRVAEIERESVELQASLDKVIGEATRVAASLEKIKPQSLISRWKRRLMEFPIIDGFNSHLRVVQDWMPKLRQTLGMAKIARFDRCRTCHLNIDKTTATGAPGFPEGHPATTDVNEWVATSAFPQPYATHSRPELFCSAASPHPVSKFGCTICHDGQGSGTSFGNAEHSPNDPHQQEQWHEQFGYHPNHFWEYPMQPARFAESTCIKCHHDVTELGINPRFGASAPKVYRGMKLIEEYGCFGCHEINGYDAGLRIGPDLRLEPQTDAERKQIAEDPTAVAGRLRKVGPSLRHLNTKVDANWVRYWTEIPSRFRPTTRMPQFFNQTEHLSGAEAARTRQMEAVEIAGIAEVLLGGSQPLELMTPANGYQPNAERGRVLFAEKGCMACHQHKAVPGPSSDKGPNISDIHLKVLRNPGNPQFSDWLYSWIRKPSRYHSRTIMPDFYFDEPMFDTDGVTPIDAAADITAFLLSQGAPGSYEVPEIVEEDLNSLVSLYLSSRFSQEAAEQIIRTGQFPQKASEVVGDEAALATPDGDAVQAAEEWRRKKLEYVGRKSIARYGCYACHDIPGYEDARPIGVALQDWGRKDTSKLGFEHIEEFLHHHGEKPGSKTESTAERVGDALRMARAGLVQAGQWENAEAERELTTAYFFDSLQHHGRAGFLWQKLRGPRTYDYRKTETKRYDERLRMPRFPLQEDEIEAIATFILGLVAEPPMEEYVYRPDERERMRIDGEFLISKYNCTGCHMLELPKVTFGVDAGTVQATEPDPADFPAALEMLLKFRPPVQALSGSTREFKVGDETKVLPLASFHGLVFSKPDMEEDPEFREHGFDTWETLDFGTGDSAVRVLPASRISIPDALLVALEPGRGGDYAEFLVEHLMDRRGDGNRYLAWQSSPPPLYQEGFKVQTNWLYQFLLEPGRIRYTTVLRMPKFNLSDEEARILASYFAAVDGAPFPYQDQGPAGAGYLASIESSLRSRGLLKSDQSYLQESWKTLNGPLCVKCHSFAGKKFKVSDPARDIQGPNLNLVHSRLRADWVKLWIYKPKWITPYTSMPVNFPHNNTSQFPDLFNGDPEAHVSASRDALWNYTRLMDEFGPVTYQPPVPSTGGNAGEAGAVGGAADAAGAADGADTAGSVAGAEE